ncbi:MAG TPA: septal ring lytic transglycosylase RlpA family protein [bacterium]|nr:septal ring lytic transglycosylase RlpA family protein [bacterium]
MRYTVLLLIFMLFLYACVPNPQYGTVASRTRGEIPGKEIIKKGYQTGVASYYAHKFHGRKTANGEIFDMHKLTAAHRTLPFNTLVKVTNLKNNKTIQVRINDRGPFAKDRIIDLSLAAAQKIDMIGSGTAEVRLDIIKEYP